MSRSEQVHVQDNYRKLSRDTIRHTYIGIGLTLPSTEHWGMHHFARVHTTLPLVTSTSWSLIASVLCTAKCGALYLLVTDVIYSCAINKKIIWMLNISCYILVKRSNPVTFCNFHLNLIQSRHFFSQPKHLH